MILCNLYNFKKKALAAAGDNIFLKKYSEAFCHELNIPPKNILRCSHIIWIWDYIWNFESLKFSEETYIMFQNGHYFSSKYKFLNY